MCHFLALSGQAEMMRENFMRMALPIFVVCCLRMKFYAYILLIRARSQVWTG